MKRTSLTICFLIGAFISCLTHRGFAQAPLSVSGATIDYIVTGGNGPYATSGKYRVFLSDSGSVYTLLRLDRVDRTYGTCSYEQNSPNQGTVTMYDALVGRVFWSAMTFSNQSGGTFYYTAALPASQWGNFQMHSGTAPASLPSKVLQLTVRSGSYPFRTSGTYRIVTSAEGNYTMQELTGASTAWKAYTYAPTNRTTGTFFFNGGLDSASSGFAELTFSGTGHGVYVMRDSNWTGYQEGTFAMTNVYAPAFATNPASRTVPVGTRVVFSASVTGTTPFTFQWYKNNSAISGATSTSHIISSAQLSNAGSYRVVAKNVGGSLSSTTATLSVFACNYTLSSNAAFFNFNGGSGAVRLAATNGCGWSASTTNSWITFTSATNGTGSATISYSVKTNSTRSPRIGALKIAGKLFNVAQGGDFSPTNIAGKNLILHITGGVGAPTNGSFMLSVATNTLQLVPLSTGIVATNAFYIFSKSNSVTAGLKFNSRVATLNFSSLTRGTFQIINANKSKQMGSFSLGNRTASFDRDPRGDFVWQNSSGALSAWFMRGVYFSGSAPLRKGTAAPSGWTAIGSADFNRDGYSDVLFQTSAGGMALWFMNQTNWTRDVLLRNGASAGVGWKAVTAADFNEDQKPDILFQNDDGRVALWVMNGTNFVSSIPLQNNQTAGAGWRALAATDLNGDRQTDILLEHSTGLISAWLMSRTNFVTSISLNGGASVGSSPRIAGAADLNSDGFNDILWQKTNGTLSCWFMKGINLSSSIALFTNQPVALNLRCAAPK